MFWRYRDGDGCPPTVECCGSPGQMLLPLCISCFTRRYQILAFCRFGLCFFFSRGVYVPGDAMEGSLSRLLFDMRLLCHCPHRHDYQVNRRHFQGHFHRAESINSWSASWQQYRFYFLSHGQLFFNFSSSFCILRFTWSALSGSHLKLWPVELGASLWRLVSADDRESISQAVQRPVLCEPSLAPCSSPLFISLMSLAGYMLLIKHATQLLIVNQIQFVPGACCEWASPLRTKVFRTATSELDKRPRASQLSPTPCRDLLKGAIQEGSQKV